MTALCGGLRRLIVLVGVLGISTAAYAQDGAPIVFPDTQYEPVDWTDLDGWNSDDHAAAFAAFLTSCSTLDKKHRQDRQPTAIPLALRDICERARQAIPLDEC